MQEQQGIFVTSPFHANPKCIFIGVALMLAYWFLPYRNKYLLPLIFIISYISIAWYDYLFDCDRKLYSGTFIGENTFDTWGKPQNRRYDVNHPDDASYVSNQELAYRRNIYLFHALGVAPFLIYIAYHGNRNDPKIYSALMMLAIMAEIYHTFRIFNPRLYFNLCI